MSQKPTDFFEIINTLSGSMRFDTRAIAPDVVDGILEMGTKAPSLGNLQPWEFIVVTNDSTKREIGALAVKASKIFQRHSGSQISRNVRSTEERFAETTETIPVILCVCLNLQKIPSRRTPSLLFEVLKNRDLIRTRNLARYGSVFPAVQNILLGARAYGVASRITMLPLFYQGRLKRILDIPEKIEPVALVYLGYPTSPFKKPKRIPASEVTHWEKW